MNDKPVLSLVMPAYNEGKDIRSVVERADDVAGQMGLRYELIVVDDGSLDNTKVEVEGYIRHNGHVKIASHKNNVGKGFALKTGFSHAAGDLIVFMDSDADINPNRLAYYIAALKDADVVVASKWHPQSELDIPIARRILSRGFNALVKLFVGLRFSDTQTGLKAVRKEALVDVFPRLVVKRYAFDVELLALTNLLNLKVAELPISISVRRLFSIRDAWRMFLDLLGITYRLRVTRWYHRAIAHRNSK